MAKRRRKKRGRKKRQQQKKKVAPKEIAAAAAPADEAPPSESAASRAVAPPIEAIETASADAEAAPGNERQDDAADGAEAEAEAEAAPAHEPQDAAATGDAGDATAKKSSPEKKEAKQAGDPEDQTAEAPAKGKRGDEKPRRAKTTSEAPKGKGTRRKRAWTVGPNVTSTAPRGFWVGALLGFALVVPSIAVSLLVLSTLGFIKPGLGLEDALILSAVFSGLPAGLTTGGVARICSRAVILDPKHGVRASVRAGALHLSPGGVGLLLLGVLPVGGLPLQPLRWLWIVVVGAALGALLGALVGFIIGSLTQGRVEGQSK